MQANLSLMEIMAHTGKDIGTLYKGLVAKYGPCQYKRIDAPATEAAVKRLNELAANPREVENLLRGRKIAGYPVNWDRVRIGDGVKIVLGSENKFKASVLKRPSGTEPIIKDYQEEKGDTRETAIKASEEIGHYLKVPTN